MKFKVTRGLISFGKDKRIILNCKYITTDIEKVRNTLRKRYQAQLVLLTYEEYDENEDNIDSIS